MALDIQGQVGPQVLADGAKSLVRLGRGGETVVQQLHGRLYEAVKRGGVFEAVVAAAGVAPGTAVGTTAAFALHNPVNSGVDIVLLQIRFGKISGTLGDGVLAACVNTGANAAPTGGTAITPMNSKLDGSSSRATARSAATLPASPTVLAVLSSIQGGVISSTNVNIDGGLVVPPGAILSVQGIAAAGTSPLIQISAQWEEIGV